MCNNINNITENMKSSVTFVLVLICTVVLAAKQSQAKKGCNAYGMACYGGHGKRAIMDNSNPAMMMGNEQNDLSNEFGLRENNGDEIETNPPPYRLIRIMKSWFNAHPRRFPLDRFNEIDYPAFVDATLNHDRTYN